MLEGFLESLRAAEAVEFPEVDKCGEGEGQRQRGGGEGGGEAESGCDVVARAGLAAGAFEGEAFVDGEDGRGTVECEDGPERPGPSRDGAGAGEDGEQGGGSEAGGADELEDDGALFIADGHPDGDGGERDGNPGERGERGDRQHGREERQAQGGAERFRGKPLEGGARLRVFGTPDEVLPGEDG